MTGDMEARRAPDAPKVVAVTGASSGIGEATARRLAADGHMVLLGARRTDRLDALTREITAAGGTAAFQRLDVTDADDVQAFVSAAREQHGRVDVVVNNAGVMPLSPLESLKTEEWNRMIDVNVRGVLHGIAAALPVMRAQGGGHCVNIASVGRTRSRPPLRSTAPPSSPYARSPKACARSPPETSGSPWSPRV
ncbi:SDR family oxidoreductase [Streptomyces sp. NPDC001177]